MRTLSYQTLRDIGYTGYVLEHAPERVLQFGEGNFLRAFAEDWVDRMNERVGFNAKAVLVQPIAQGLTDAINEQEGLYTLYLRGRQNGEQVCEKRVISCVSRCIDPYADFQALLDCAKNPELRFILSNTTEAGIVFDPESRFDQTPPDSFPAKLTRFLYERFMLSLPGFVILSCELIDDNGKELERCVREYIRRWGLPETFAAWVSDENVFCSTLVDRIVTGYPRAEADALNAENGYADRLLDTGEIFGFWVIEGPDWLKNEFPAERAGLPVLITRDHAPYKQRKVRILNGAHTALTPGAFLAGKEIVRDCMSDPVLRGFMNRAIDEEILPTLTLPEDETRGFAAAVADRFENPFIDHELLSIALNTTAKWKARLGPSLLGYTRKFGRLPKTITAAFAFYIAFYRTGHTLENGVLTGSRDGRDYPIRDDAWVLEFFYEHRRDDARSLVSAVVRNERMWGTEFAALPGFEDAVTDTLCAIETLGAYEAMQR